MTTDGGFFDRATLTAVRSPLPALPACGKCGLLKGCLSPKMPPFGDGRLGLFVVGEAPGATEDRDGRPFVGAAGTLLRDTLRAAGASLDGDCRTMNALSCFVGSTRVQSPSGVQKVYRRRYSGLMTTVQTFSGRVLTGTPNHPILTPRGWVPLGLLQEGDDLVCCDLGKGSGLGGPDVNQPPPTFEEIFRSATELGNFRRVVGRCVDFHGDGETSDVDVVGAYGLLRLGLDAPISEHFVQPLFVTADERLVGLERDGPSDPHFSDDVFGNLFSPQRVVGGLGQSETAVCPQPIEADFHGGTAAPQFDTQPLEDVAETAVGSAQRVGERLKALTGLVSTDRVVKVERQVGDEPFGRDDGSDWSGHVYNLETGHGYYIANGIVVSNCRPPANKVDDPKKVDYCRPLVLRELEAFAPTAVLLLGAKAIRSVLGRLWHGDLGEVERWVGWAIPVRRWNCWVCPTYHPAHLLRNRNRRGDSDDPVKDMMFAAHVDRAVRLSAVRPWPDPVPSFDGRVEAVMDPDRAAALLAAVPAGTTIAFDYETTTLKPDGSHAEIVCCAVSDGATAFAYPWHGPAVAETKALLFDPAVRKVTWSKMEDRWTRAKLGGPIVGWDQDGMLDAHCLYNRAGGGDDDRRQRGRGVTGLKFQAFVQTGLEDYSSDISTYLKSEVGGCNEPNRIRQAPLALLLKYNAMDALLTHIICRKLKRELEDSV